MSDCEQCAALQRQNDFLANDRDGYVQSLTDENNKLRAENERLNKSRNKWGQKYNKLLEKHKVTLSQLKTAVWSDSEECKLLNAENEKLRAALDILQAAMTIKKPIPMAFKKAILEARAALTQETRDE